MDFPLYKIAKRCRHWTAAKNVRFKLYRIDRVDECGKSHGAVWDAEERDWREGAYFYNTEWLRDATPDEIHNTELLI